VASCTLQAYKWRWIVSHKHYVTRWLNCCTHTERVIIILLQWGYYNDDQLVLLQELFWQFQFRISTAMWNSWIRMPTCQIRPESTTSGSHFLQLRMSLSMRSTGLVCAVVCREKCSPQCTCFLLINYVDIFPLVLQFCWFACWTVQFLS